MSVRGIAVVALGVLCVVVVGLVSACSGGEGGDAGGADGGAGKAEIVVGSKKFTENIILGEMLAQLAEAGGADARHRDQLGGSRVLFSGLVRGDIDAYPEYTGTLRYELLAGEDVGSDEALRAALAERGLAMSEPIGFDNSYAIGVLPGTKAEYGLETIGDLAEHPELRYGFTNEFMDRADGWPGLRDAYGLPATGARGMDHDLAYRALEAGSIEVMDLYATDAEIAYYGIELLEDDRGYFPEYEAVVLYRRDLERLAPGALASMLRLEGAIDADEMRGMNELAKIGRESDGATERRSDEGEDVLVRVPEGVVAQEFLRREFGVEGEVEVEGRVERLVRTTVEHLWLVGASMGLALLVGVPLGVMASWSRLVGGPILGVSGVLQTVPALAMLVLLIPAFGLTAETAIAALVLYSILPIVRNTHAGLVGVPGDIDESAAAIGLGRWARLVRVDMPLALPTVFAGVKTAAVINIGTATLAALIGTGGYGQPILTGIRLDDFGLILEGAVPAALMAILAVVLLDVVERVVVSRGVRG